MPQIIVIGGGVIGLSCALRLAEAGHGVTLFDDPAPAKAASWGNAGHIATEQVAPLAAMATLRSAWGRRFATGGALDLPRAALRHWLPFGLRMIAASRPARFAAGRAALGALLADALPAWQRLAAAIGDPALVKPEGHMILWETPASAAQGLRAWRNSPIGTATIAPLAAEALAALGQSIATPMAGGARFAGTGQIADLDRLGDRLRAALRAQGGTLIAERAVLRRAGDGVAVQGHAADQVLVCAGVRSGAVLRAAGHMVPIIAERGYHLRADNIDWPETLPPLVFEDRSMIVTRFAGCVQASSFVELSAVDAPPDPRKWERLAAHIAELGLPMHAPFERWMGARPTLPDYLPAIGRSHRAANLFYAFGHQHLGLTLAAITAELTAALIGGGAPAIDLSPYDLNRFHGA